MGRKRLSRCLIATGVAKVGCLSTSKVRSNALQGHCHPSRDRRTIREILTVRQLIRLSRPTDSVDSDERAPGRAALAMRSCDAVDEYEIVGSYRRLRETGFENHRIRALLYAGKPNWRELPVIRLGRHRLVPKVALWGPRRGGPAQRHNHRRAVNRSSAFSMLPCGRPQQRPHECPHPWSGRRDRRAHVDPFIDRKSSQGRRSRGVRRVGRRALTARADSGGHNRCGRPVRAGLDAPRPLPVVSLVAPERVRRLGGAAWHCQCKCVTLCSSRLSSADESPP
jgi:hypothetical protein